MVDNRGTRLSLDFLTCYVYKGVILLLFFGGVEDRQYDVKSKAYRLLHGYMFIGLAIRWSETTTVLFVYLLCLEVDHL